MQDALAMDDGRGPFPRVPGIFTRDARMRALLELIRRAAPCGLPILLQGESGTGKELAAREIHELSARAAGPFVALNCGAIAPELAEAELFGHERGAFTGAVSSSPGAFGAADGGTLFLDEVGDLPANLQVKLLRALEAAEVKPVGAARPRSVEVRVVSASHRDLRALVRAAAFREDLYFRLRGLCIELPPLRDRPGDILPLAVHFLDSEPRPLALSPEACAALRAHRWPGNVRELRNAVRLAAALCDGGIVRVEDLRLETEPLEAAPRAVAEPCADAAETVHLRGRTLDELEAIAIRAAHRRHGGARRTMAAELGIARSSLLRKLSLLGLRGGGEG